MARSITLFLLICIIATFFIYVVNAHLGIHPYDGECGKSCGPAFMKRMAALCPTQPSTTAPPAQPKDGNCDNLVKKCCTAGCCDDEILACCVLY